MGKKKEEQEKEKAMHGQKRKAHSLEREVAMDKRNSRTNNEGENLLEKEVM